MKDPLRLATYSAFMLALAALLISNFLSYSYIFRLDVIGEWEITKHRSEPNLPQAITFNNCALLTRSPAFQAVNNSENFMAITMDIIGDPQECAYLPADAFTSLIKNTYSSHYKVFNANKSVAHKQETTLAQHEFRKIGSQLAHFSDFEWKKNKELGVWMRSGMFKKPRFNLFVSLLFYVSAFVGTCLILIVKRN